MYQIKKIHLGQIDVILSQKFRFCHHVLFFVKNAIFLREIDVVSLTVFCVSHPSVAVFKIRNFSKFLSISFFDFVPLKSHFAPVKTHQIFAGQHPGILVIPKSEIFSSICPKWKKMVS